MSVHHGRPSLLDIAASVLVADPAASLAEVAEAAGIGRTTLHRTYKTRDDLIRAVAIRVIDLWDAAVDAVEDAPDGGLRELTVSLVPIGPQLAFLWRTPAFDNMVDIGARWLAAEERGLAVLRRSRDRDVLTSDVPDWWLLQTYYSLIYVAAMSVTAGYLAPREAPDLVLSTFLRGLGAPSTLKEKL